MTNLIPFDTTSDMGKIQELRDILRAKLETKAISQIALAKATGVDQASINRFYKKGEGLSAENFIKLAEWAGARIAWVNEDAPTGVDCSKFTETIKSLEQRLEHAQKVMALQEESLSLYREIHGRAETSPSKKEAPEKQEIIPRESMSSAIDNKQPGTDSG